MLQTGTCDSLDYLELWDQVRLARGSQIEASSNGREQRQPPSVIEIRLTLSMSFPSQMSNLNIKSHNCGLSD
jgi:hypothetical protein